WNFAPRGTAECNGQLLPIAENQALFSLLGTNFGGDGRTTFGLPDLRGRAALHQGTGPGLTPRQLGQKLGSETNTLNSGQLPAHNHGLTQARVSVPVSSDDANQDENEGNFLANGRFYHNVPDAVYGNGPIPVTGNTDNTGSGQSINNMQPFQVVNYVIVLQGLFPSRN
ncbi:MAG: tail fiber protein, partial [Bacteroidota bacterium]